MMDRQRSAGEALQLTSRSQKGNSQCPKSGGIPHYFFFPCSLMLQTPHKPQRESIGAQTLREGNLTLHLKELRHQEDGQSPSALLPLSALMTLGSIVGTVTHVAAIAG